MDRETRMRRIWETIQDIPPGCVASYGQIAEIAGFLHLPTQKEKHLPHTPEEVKLPWHRVIQSSGKSAFDPNSRAFTTQRGRLADEGVAMLNGKVNMSKYRWEPGLDELLWKPTSTWDED